MMGIAAPADIYIRIHFAVLIYIKNKEKETLIIWIQPAEYSEIPGLLISGTFAQLASEGFVMSG